MLECKRNSYMCGFIYTSEHSNIKSEHNMELFYKNLWRTHGNINYFHTCELRPLLVESSVDVIFYVVFLMHYALIINYYFWGKFFFQLRENRG